MSRAKGPTHCPNCNAEKGWYDGPNGKPRCVACFTELQPEPEATPKAPARTEPVHNKAVAPPEPVKADGKQQTAPGSAGRSTKG